MRGAREDSSGGTEDTVKLLSCIVPGMRRQLGWLCVLPVLTALTPNPTVHAATPSFSSAMQTASQARNVPLPLIQAIAYGVYAQDSAQYDDRIKAFRLK